LDGNKISKHLFRGGSLIYSPPHFQVEDKEIHSKFKLSQNRNEVDRNNVVNEVSSRDKELAELMRSI